MSPDEIQAITEIVLQVIGLFSIIAAVTPTPVDNTILMVLKKIIDLGALNIGQAKKKD